MNLDRLIEQVRTEVVLLSQGANANDDLYRQHTALSLLARVPVWQSSAIYASLTAGGITIRDVDAALDLGAGICGHHVGLALSVTQALDVPCRQVQVFYTEGDAARNHTFVEIEWGRQWRMVDLTWGFIPHRGSMGTALSYAEAREHNHRTGLHHSCIPWRLAIEAVDDIFGYLSPEPDAIFYNGGGEVRISPMLHGDGAIYALPHGIYEIGRAQHELRVEERRLKLQVPAGRWLLTLVGSVSGSGTLSVDDTTVELTEGRANLLLDTSGPGEIDISYDPSQELGHIEIASVDGNLSPLESTSGGVSAESRTSVRLLDQSRNTPTNA